MTRRFSKFKTKVTILTIFCMIFMLSMPINVAAATASDISNHWAKTTIQSWMDQGFIAGYPDGTFKPDNNISRAEFMILVNKSFGYTATAPITFSDVNEDAWYAPAVAIAKAAGYIGGYPDGTMKPDSKISREEAATIIMKIKNFEADSNAANIFTDADKLTWSKGAVGAAVKAKIMNGYPDGSFGPQMMIKRGECAVSLDRAKKYVAEPNTPTAPTVTRNDELNTVSGMNTMMEYKLDSSNWTTYVASVFNALDFAGNHTLMVRIAAVGDIPFSPATTLMFTTNADSVVTVSGVSLNTATASIVVGSTKTLVATVAPANATNKSVTWTSNDTAVATVNSTGVVTGVSAGTAVVTVTTSNGSKTATCNVTVTAAPSQAVLSVTVSPDAVSMATTKGSTSQLTATVVVVGGAAQTVSWTSSDTSAVTVNTNGRVSVVRYAALGSYTITAKSTVDPTVIGTSTITLY